MPNGKLVTLRVACPTWELNGSGPREAEPRAVLPRLKVTVPVGGGTTFDAITSAVSVVAEPRPMVLGLASMLIVGVALVMVKVIGVVLEDALKLASPE